MTHRFGWTPDAFDPRDLTFSAPPHLLATPTPPAFSLRAEMPPVYDQLQLGSCTGNAGAALGQHALRKQGLPDFIPSRLDLYYQARAIEGTVRSDNGAQLRDVLKAMGKLGMPPEWLWPYDVTKFARKPTVAVQRAALKHVATKYAAVPQTLTDLKTAIVAGYPVAFGFTAYASLESDAVAKSGVLPMPKPHEQIIGGHAVTIVAFDDSQQTFLIRNSWGEGWGQGGYFTMPYAYVLNSKLSSDFWIIQGLSG